MTSDEVLVERARALWTTKCDRPTPLKVGAAEGSDEWDEELGDVNAVCPGSQCHLCKGWRHMARECATPAAVEKGGKDKGGKGGEGR